MGFYQHKQQLKALNTQRKKGILNDSAPVVLLQFTHRNEKTAHIEHVAGI